MAIKDIKFKKKFQLKDNQDNYTFKLKRRCNWWWLLLLLLPLLLLINCSHDVVVEVVDEQGDPIEQVGVDMNYTSSYLYKTGGDSISGWFKHINYDRHEVTDASGRAVFHDVGTSLYSYLFYMMSTAVFDFTYPDDCFTIEEAPLTKKLHSTRYVKVQAQKRRTQVRMQVLDIEDESPIADAEVKMSWQEGKRNHSKTVKSDANGVITVDSVWICAVFDKIESKAYAYCDTTIENMPATNILSNPDQAVIHMRPVKESFTFFVKDKETQQPIPNAECTISITHKNSKKSAVAKTNVDGKGRGEYKDAPVAATIAIDPVTAKHYKAGKLDPQYTVEEFIKLPDDKRVIFLEPEPYTEQFQNVDSITGKGIKGVTNKIKISGPGGNSEETLMSNANGYFAVTAKAGYRIEIISECEPAYNPKTTVIASFSKPQVIKMKPRVVDITFRTVDADYTDVLVENCKLTIRGSESGLMQPTNSGKGEFTVKSVRITEQISITSSKQMYKTNDYTIKNQAASYLADASTPASARIIPMTFILDPCDMKAFNHKEGLTYEKVAYNLGKRKGVCTFTYNTCDKYADHLLIYNCPPDDVDKNSPVWQTQGPVLTNGYKEATFEFSSPIITVVAKSHDNNGTNWDMKFDCNNIKETK